MAPEKAGAMQRLEARFHEIREAFFPRWDRKGAWRVRAGSNAEYPGAEGFCQSSEKTIYINLPESGDLNLVLIHEISHAVAGVGHGRRWLDRMRKAATRARDLRTPSLAKRLEAEVARYGRASGPSGR
jgi:hypothetical protein